MSPNMFGRPDDPINEDPTEISSPNAPNVNVAYPTFNDWLGLYNFDNTLTRGEAWNRSLFTDMKGSYERAVLALLNLIAKSSVGRAVLTEIMLGPLFEVRILPYDFQSGRWSVGTGAVTRAWNQRASWVKDVPLSGQTADGKPYVSTSATTGRPIVGTGVGSSADIFFTPSRHTGKNEAEETLLHELLHASRKVRGVTYRMPVSGGYGNIELGRLPVRVPDHLNRLFSRDSHCLVRASSLLSQFLSVSEKWDEQSRPVFDQCRREEKSRDFGGKRHEHAFIRDSPSPVRPC